MIILKFSNEDMDDKDIYKNLEMKFDGCWGEDMEEVVRQFKLFLIGLSWHPEVVDRIQVVEDD